MEQELHFEALAEFVQDRDDLLLLELAHGGLVDDAAIDLYNERSSRFEELTDKGNSGKITSAGFLHGLDVRLSLVISTKSGSTRQITVDDRTP